MLNLEFLGDPDFDNVELLAELVQHRSVDVRALLLTNPHVCGPLLSDLLAHTKLTHQVRDMLNMSQMMGGRSTADQTALVVAAAKASQSAADELTARADVPALRALLQLVTRADAGHTRIAAALEKMFASRHALRNASDHPDFGLFVDEYRQHQEIPESSGVELAAACARGAADPDADTRIRNLLATWSPTDSLGSLEVFDELAACAYDNPARLLVWAGESEAGALLASLDDRIIPAQRAQLAPIQSAQAKSLHRTLLRRRGRDGVEDLHHLLDAAMAGSDADLRDLQRLLRLEAERRETERAGKVRDLGSGYVYRTLRALHEATAPSLELIREARTVRGTREVPARAAGLVESYASLKLLDHADTSGLSEEDAQRVRDNYERQDRFETRRSDALEHFTATRDRIEQNPARVPFGDIRARTHHGRQGYRSPAARWLATKLRTVAQVELLSHRLSDRAWADVPLAEAVDAILADRPETDSAEFVDVFGDALGQL